MSEIKIIGLMGESININIIGKSYPQEKNKWDSNWLNAQIKIKIGRFSGKIDAYLTYDELVVLLKDTNNFINSEIDTIVFSPIEPWIKFQMTCNKKNTIEIIGEVTDRLGTGNVLKFLFRCNKFILNQMIESITKIQKEFSIAEK